jgi:hypothetical protein
VVAMGEGNGGNRGGLVVMALGPWVKERFGVGAELGEVETMPKMGLRGLALDRSSWQRTNSVSELGHDPWWMGGSEQRTGRQERLRAT